MPPYSLNLRIRRLHEEAQMAGETAALVEDKEVKFFVRIVALARSEFRKE